MSDSPYVAPEPVIDELRVITRAFARHIAEMCPVDGDRRFKETIDSILRPAIVRGSYRGSDWIVVYCIGEERWYRLNGKHSSLLCCDENHSITTASGKPIRARYMEYEVATWDEVVELNDEIDRRESGRSEGDDYRNRASRMSSLEGASDTVIKAIAGGLAHVAYGVRYGKKSTSKERGKLLPANPDFCAFAVEIMGTKKKFFQMTAVVAALADSFADDPEAALIFWLSVGEGSNANSKSTERKLQLWLTDQKASVRNGRWTNALKVAVRAKCVREWERWQKARTSKPTSRRRSTKVTSRTNSSERTAAKKGLK